MVRDPVVKDRVDFLKNFGIKDEFTVLMPGINGKMNELQGGLLGLLDSEDGARRAQEAPSDRSHLR